MKQKLTLIAVFAIVFASTAWAGINPAEGQTAYEAEDFYSTGGTFNGFQVYTTQAGITGINYNQSGDYGSYNIWPPYEGTYQIKYNISTPVDGAGIEFACDGVAIFDNVPNNGSWDDFQELTSSQTIEFTDTLVSIRIKSVLDGGPGAWQWNMDKFELVPVTIYATDIILASNDVTLEEDQTFSLNGQIIPAEATDDDIIYSTSDNSVAWVGYDGTITAVAGGVAVITATSGDGRVVKQCIVTVDAPASTFVIEGEDFNAYISSFGTNPYINYAFAEDGEQGYYTLMVSNNNPYYPMSYPRFQSGEYAIEYLISTTSSNSTIAVEVTSGPGTTNIGPYMNTLPNTNGNFQWITASNTVSLERWRNNEFILRTTGETVHIDQIRFTKVGSLNVSVQGLEAYSDDTLTLEPDNWLMQTICVEFTPVYATNQNVIWSSSNTDVVEIEETGNIYYFGGGKAPVLSSGRVYNDLQSKAAGTAIITATSEEGGYSVSFTVIVENEFTDEVVIEAEDFVNTSGTYDDSYAGGPGYGVNATSTNINYVNTGDWAEYSFDVPSDGEYKVEYYISTPSYGAEITSYIDGELVLVDEVPNNGEWDDFQRMVLYPYVDLTAGNHTFKIEASSGANWQWNLDKIVLTKERELKGALEEEALTAESGFILYPTSVIDVLTIELSSVAAESGSIDMFNSLGQLVRTENIELGESIIELNVSNLSNGIYIVRTGNNTQMFLKK